MAMPRVKLGDQGLEVSRLGFGCMTLTGVYNNPLSEEDGIQMIKECFNNGVTFFDTSDFYGLNHSNEILVGKLEALARTECQCEPHPVCSRCKTPNGLKHLPREKVQLATKFGICKIESTKVTVKGTPEYVRSCCENSLKRLDVDYIDLYYIHRIDTSVPIEDTMGELKKLVEEGKIKYIGLSEANCDTIKRAHAVHPITAIQMEYSLWTRDIEDEIIPLCRDLGIGIVPYSPLGRGFFAGKATKESLPENSVLAGHPRFSGSNYEKNKIMYERVEALTKKHNCTPAQLALAWVLHQGDDVVPIPGTTKIKNLKDNIGSVGVKLTKEEVQEISDAVPIDEIGGARIGENLLQVSWKYATTPQKDGK